MYVQCVRGARTCVIKCKHPAVAKLRGSVRVKAKQVEAQERALRQKHDNHLINGLSVVEVVIRSVKCFLLLLLLPRKRLPVSQETVRQHMKFGAEE